MDKEQLIAKIKELPGLTNDEKADLLGLLRSHKKYGLVWEDKPEEVEERLREELPIFTEAKERAIISENPDAPNHILIEGDNLEALTTLSYTHEGKIDVIYIDPPYNTGNKDFIYNDKYVDSEDSYRHSKWLSFMSKRLKIAKRLLSEKGVIFISIDDNEQAQLKLLCDEVFGNHNYIGLLPRITKKSGKDHSGNIAKNNDFLLTYAHNVSNVEFNGIVVEESGYSNEDEYVSTRGKYKLNQTLDYDSLWYNPAMDFPIEVDGGIFYAGGDKDSYINRHNGIHNPKDWVWRWSKKKFDFGLENGFVVFKKGKKGVRIYTKTYLNASISKDGDSYKIEYFNRKSNLSSLAFVDNEFSNDNAKKQMAEVIEANAFDFPKPITLIRNILLQLGDSSTILDFFAGSGTTLHATMQLNAEDGGIRQCILVTNNENGICENVTYQRNKRVINGYTTPKGEEVAGLKDNTLRYYRTELLPRERSPRNMRALMSAATDLLCIKEDLYAEQSMFGQYKTHPKVMRYFADGAKHMLVLYREEFATEIAEAIKTMDFGGGRLKIYIFSPGRYAFDDEFFEVQDKVQLVALPAAIYDAYQKVLPKRKDKPLAEEPSEEAQAIQTTLFDDEEGGTL